MVKALLLIALLLTSTAQAASLSAQLDKTDGALGEPISLTVQARGLSLDTLDVTPLGANFEVFARTLSRAADSETLVLMLYPRRSGALRLPALQLDTLHTAARTINVTDGSETVPRVTAIWTLDPVAPHVNQPVRLTLAICDDGSLQWQRPGMHTGSGRLLRALGEEDGRGERAGEPCTLHQYFWSFIATQSGMATLHVPMLDAGRFGQRLRFPGPTLAIQVAGLPAWLPDAVPPVAPHIQSAPLPARWPLQRPLAWNFQVTGGYSAAGLKSLIELQWHESPALGMYPPLIEEVAMGDPASPLSRYGVTLYLQPREGGAVSVPALHLPWYDVSRKQLASAVVPARTLTVYDPRWILGKRIAAGLAGLLLLGGSIWQLRRMARWRLARRRGMRAIRQAGDVEELAQAVRQFSLTEQAAAPSLGEWLHRMQQQVRCNPEAAVRQLEQQQYGQAAYPLAILQQAFLRALAQSRPRS